VTSGPALRQAGQKRGKAVRFTATRRHHSRSMINEPSKLLVHKGFDDSSALFTVAFTVAFTVNLI
jgi:hypothetical protein